MVTEPCVICGKPFNPETWDQRHDLGDGYAHDPCCRTSGPCAEAAT